MSDLKLQKKGFDHGADVASRERFDVTSAGRQALDEDCAVEGVLDESGDAARTAAVFGNFDTVAKQQRLISELHQKLDDQAAVIRELTASERMSLRAIQGLTRDRDGALAQVAELLAENLRLAQLLEKVTS